MFELRSSTPESWIDAVVGDIDAFLVDHAACERKASATGMSFVVKYPDRTELLDPLIAFAREELAHFHLVYQLLLRRGVRLGADTRDEYVRRLLALARQGGGDDLLLDRLLVAGVVEARGCERFRLLARALPDAAGAPVTPGAELRQLYLELAGAEARHHTLFVELALVYYEEPVVRARLDELLDAEAAIIAALPFRAALH